MQNLIINNLKFLDVIRWMFSVQFMEIQGHNSRKSGQTSLGRVDKMKTSR